MANTNRLKITEDEIQIALFEWIALHPKIKGHIIHVPNEGKRSLAYGRKLKRMGLTAGVSDIFIAIPSNPFHGAFIELKSENGRLNDNQLAFLKRMKEKNYYTKVCYSLDEAIHTIKWYCQI